ncbi:hypothetical protein Hanom_Chr11g01007711 [Helianthus anomalus]
MNLIVKYMYIFLVLQVYAIVGSLVVQESSDGDFVEAKMLLDCNPCLAKYSTFGVLNSPLHFADAKGHNDV